MDWQHLWATVRTAGLPILIFAIGFNVFLYFATRRRPRRRD